jgi:small subunit ribosomal protein S3Ae
MSGSIFIGIRCDTMAEKVQQKGGGAPRKKMTQSQAGKKWKGKDWFDIVSPAEFGGNILYQTPSTDPESLIGRNVSVPASEVTGDRSKYYMWLKFKISEVNGSNANTIPNGFQCTSEYLSRMVRKKRDKIEITHVVMTKDGWKIRIKPILIMTRNISSSIKTDIRNSLVSYLEESAKNMTMVETIQEIIKGSYQMKMKKQLSKIYPVRFTEVGRIKILEIAKEVLAAAPALAEEIKEETEKAKEHVHKHEKEESSE